MINSVSLSPQTVAAGNNVLFAADRVRTHACRCNCGWLEHDAGSGLFTLTKPGVYRVDVAANVSLAAAGNVALAIQANGETVGGTQMLTTVATADDYQTVDNFAMIEVACGSSKTVSVGNIGNTDALVETANIAIQRLC